MEISADIASRMHQLMATARFASEEELLSFALELAAADTAKWEHDVEQMLVDSLSDDTPDIEMGPDFWDDITHVITRSA